MAELTGWRARTSFADGLEQHRRLVPRERGLVAGHPRSQPARLLVLGAGRGAARPARGRAAARPLGDRGRPRPARARVRASPTSARSSRPRTRPAIERLARAREVDGIISPGADWPVGDRGAGRRAPRPAASDQRRHGGARDVEDAPARALRRRGRAAAADASRWAMPEITFPCVVKAPDRQGQRGLTLVRDAGRARGRRRDRASPSPAAAACLVEELVDGPELTVNAVSVDGGSSRSP